MYEHIRASEITAYAWLNTDRPLTMRELRGQVVVLDFWTYCCINCMHVLPVLAELEHRRQHEPLVVIGVHSGKFDAEQDPDRIREAIARYDIKHPVAVDYGMQTWEEYGVRSWPTLVIIRPNGTVAAVAPGEADIETLDGFIGRVMADARADGSLAASPLKLTPPESSHPSPLRYPGKAEPLPDGTIAVSDSANNRLIVMDRDGRTRRVIGCGTPGLVDGNFDIAQFCDPQGMAWYDGCLLVADTRNHAIRKVDFASETVSTVAGIGELGRSVVRGMVDARSVALRSPWDLCVVGNEVVVAMAGTHQLWKFVPSTGRIGPWAGTGAESLVDGPLHLSAWAQPSGLSHRNGLLFVADSETSSVRAVRVADGRVVTLVGKGLFDFGDADGPSHKAALQHCLGVAAVEGGVLVADTYNGKIKLVTWPDGHVSTVTEGLSEPGSVRVLADGSLLIADTNAHRIIRFHDGKLTEITPDCPSPRCSGKAPCPPPVNSPDCGDWFSTILTLSPDDGLAPGSATLAIHVKAPQSAEFSLGSPVTVAGEVSRRPDLLEFVNETMRTTASGGQRMDLHIPLRVNALPGDRVESEMVLALSFVLCFHGDNDRCEPRELKLRVPVRLRTDGRAEQHFSISL